MKCYRASWGNERSREQGATVKVSTGQRPTGEVQRRSGAREFSIFLRLSIGWGRERAREFGGGALPLTGALVVLRRACSGDAEAGGGGVGASAPAVVYDAPCSNGGRPLDPGLRSDFEPGFGRDLGADGTANLIAETYPG